LEIYLDRGNSGFVLESLNNCRDTVIGQNDENFLLDWEILECRAFVQFEKVKEAKHKYEDICQRYPNDPRPFLYLAEIYLNDGNHDKTDELIRKAEKIDGDYWLLQLEELNRPAVVNPNKAPVPSSG